MTTKEVIAKYGEPNITGQGYLASIVLPYRMKLAWDPSEVIMRTVCHKLIVPNLTGALNDVLKAYGKDDVEKLGLDLFGGTFNYRKMRNGQKMSMHSWGLAIDLDPARNQLKWGRDKAQFAKKEYEPLIKAFYDNGFINLGVEKNYDWMHFEIKS